MIFSTAGAYCIKSARAFDCGAGFEVAEAAWLLAVLLDSLNTQVNLPCEKEQPAYELNYSSANIFTWLEDTLPA